MMKTHKDDKNEWNVLCPVEDKETRDIEVLTTQITCLQDIDVNLKCTLQIHINILKTCPLSKNRLNRVLFY